MGVALLESTHGKLLARSLPPPVRSRRSPVGAALRRARRASDPRTRVGVACWHPPRPRRTPSPLAPLFSVVVVAGDPPHGRFPPHPLAVVAVTASPLAEPVAGLPAVPAAGVARVRTCRVPAVPVLFSPPSPHCWCCFLSLLLFSANRIPQKGTRASLPQSPERFVLLPT